VARDRAITAAERDAAALAPVLALTNDSGDVTAAIARTATGADRRLSVFLPDGRLLGDTSPPDKTALALATGRRVAFSAQAGAGLVVYSPVITAGGSVSVIRARIPGRLLDAGVHASWTALGAVAIALTGAAVLIADRLARSLTRDASAVAETARSLASGQSSARVTPRSTPELADAGRALNLLADRIDELRTAERERVADLSHRLRTPLTALRLDAEAAQNTAVLTGVERLETAITELVRAARRPLHSSPVGATCDLADIARGRAGFWSALADDDNRPWTLDIPAERRLVIRLGGDDTAAAIDALIGNVFAHTPEGTRYAIAVTDDGSTACLSIDDAGPGIPEPQRVLARGVTDAGSTGLGLDIARQAAHIAGGTITIGPADLGGASVTLCCPLVRNLGE
jgi:signal transduction histidine kinase